MKTQILIIFIIIGHFSSGQIKKDTTISIRILDSLKYEICAQKDRANSLYWKNRLLTAVTKIDTVVLRQDSMDIISYSKNGQKVSIESIKFRAVDCKESYINRFFNEKEQLIYLEYWDAKCYTKEEIEKGDGFFSSRMRKKERIEYDYMGRIINIFSFEDIGYRKNLTKCITYSYNLDDIQTQKIEVLKNDQFWD